MRETNSYYKGKSAIRLNRFVASCLGIARRKAEGVIRGGKICVNGKAVTHPGYVVTLDKDVVEMDGRKLKLPDKRLWYALNKPPGFICTVSDPQGRPTIMDLIPGDLLGKVFPVGRLDFMSRGLLLLTNDGVLANAILHPPRGVEKEYHVLVIGKIDQEAIRRAAMGVSIGYAQKARAEISVLRAFGARQQLRVVIHEGRKHIVRQLLGAFGLQVEDLCRVRIGPIYIGNLQEGNIRRLSPREICLLESSVNKAPWSHAS